jgi:hypothetical protein
MKHIYKVPSIKVVSFKVEEGFASLEAGDKTQDETLSPVYGTSEIKTNLSTDNWAGSTI